MPQLFGLIVLALWITALIDVIRTDTHQCRHLPKFGWILVIILVPTVGALLWFILGRPWDETPGRSFETPSRFPEYQRPGRHIAQTTEDDEEFLRRCRERAEEQRRIARERRKAEENRDTETN